MVEKKWFVNCKTSSQSKTQIPNAHQKGRIDWTKKGTLAPKKVPLGFRGFCTYFWEVEHPLCEVWMTKTQIPNAHGRITILSDSGGKLCGHWVGAASHTMHYGWP